MNICGDCVHAAVGACAGGEPVASHSGHGGAGWALSLTPMTRQSHTNQDSSADARQDLLNRLIATAAQRPLNQGELGELNDSNAGFDAQVGIRYTHLSRGEVRGVIHARPQHHQPWGLVNGGVYASFAESLGSIAGVIVAGCPVVGVNNSTDFIRSVKQGPIEGVARPLQTGRRTQLWEVEMSHGGELVAKSTLRTIVVGA